MSIDYVDYETVQLENFFCPKCANNSPGEVKTIN